MNKPVEEGALGYEKRIFRLATKNYKPFVSKKSLPQIFLENFWVRKLYNFIKGEKPEPKAKFPQDVKNLTLIHESTDRPFRSLSAFRRVPFSNFPQFKGSGIKLSLGK